MLPAGRRHSDRCDIWSLVAPEVTCPACSGEVSVRWEQEAAQQEQEVDNGSTMPFADVPAVRPADVRAEAGVLLQLLSR